MTYSIDSFRDSVVAVTGATGFIGAHLTERLCELGAEVHSLSRSIPQFKHSRFHTRQIDLCDDEAVSQAVNNIKPNYVFHLASHVMGAPDLAHVLPTFHANLETTVNLLTACAETGYGQDRIVLTGSLVEPPPGEREKEIVPSCPYAAAKWASSSYARMFHALYDLPTSIARVFMVYGPAQRDKTKLVPYVIRSLLQGEQPKITSGQRQIDWIYVADVVEGFLAIATAEGTQGQSVDLGSGQYIATRDLVQRIVELMDTQTPAEFGALPDRPLEPVRTADVERSHRQTGWRPSVSLDQGLADTIAYYRGVWG